MMIAWYFATALAKQYETAVPYIQEQCLEKFLPILAGVFQALGGFTAEVKSFLMFFVPVAIGLVFLWKAPAVLSVYWMTNSALRFLEYKIFSLKAVRNWFLKVPTTEEMMRSIS